LEWTKLLQLLTGQFKTVGDLDGEIKDSETSPLVKEMEFVESICKLTIPLVSTKKVLSKNE
jgi:hypothetical protein